MPSAGESEKNGTHSASSLKRVGRGINPLTNKIQNLFAEAHLNELTLSSPLNAWRILQEAGEIHVSGLLRIDPVVVDRQFSF